MASKADLAAHFKGYNLAGDWLKINKEEAVILF
jgi:hypothetical protein